MGKIFKHAKKFEEQHFNNLVDFIYAYNDNIRFLLSVKLWYRENFDE